MSSARNGEYSFPFNWKPDMFKDTEVFLISQQVVNPENLTVEERLIIKTMGLKDVFISEAGIVYKNKHDAIAVAKNLVKTNPHRNLAVLAAKI